MIKNNLWRDSGGWMFRLTLLLNLGTFLYIYRSAFLNYCQNLHILRSRTNKISLSDVIDIVCISSYYLTQKNFYRPKTERRHCTCILSYSINSNLYMYISSCIDFFCLLIGLGALLSTGLATNFTKEEVGAFNT